MIGFHQIALEAVVLGRLECGAEERVAVVV